jgi:hypothetical protein
METSLRKLMGVTDLNEVGIPPAICLLMNMEYSTCLELQRKEGMSHNRHLSLSLKTSLER